MNEIVKIGIIIDSMVASMDLNFIIGGLGVEARQDQVETILPPKQADHYDQQESNG